MDDFFPEQYLNIIPGYCYDKQKNRSGEDAKKNVPVFDQERNDKIESVKIDKA
jgi:hypothetical protein